SLKIAAKDNKKRERSDPSLPFLFCVKLSLPAIASAAAHAAATAAAIAAAAHTAAHAATAARPSLLRPRLIDDERATVELRAVQSVDRLLGFLPRVHLDEAETPRLAGKLVRDHPRRLYAAVLGEDLFESPFRHGIGQAAHV